MQIQNFLSQLLVGVLVIIIISWTAGESAVGQMPITFIAAFVLVVFLITEVFLPLSDAISHLQRYQDSLQRLESMSKGELQIDRREGKSSRTLSKEEQQQLAKKEVQITFENVTFTNQTGKTALEDISFIFEPGNKTILLITHHLIGIRPYDKILFLDDGKIVINGKHHQLLLENSRYQKLIS